MVGMTIRRILSSFAVVLVVGATSPSRLAASGPRFLPINIEPGHVVLEVVGQVNNFAASDDAPLGSSQQFGYVSNLEGVANVFTDTAAANQNETTAMLTFVTNVDTTRVTADGPFSMIIREGTTTFYRNTEPATFSTPASFQSGEPVLTSTIRQQVIVDTVQKTFTVVNVNAITSTKSFDLGIQRVRIGRPGDMIRTSLMGVLRARDGVPPPTGYFAGSGVGVPRLEQEHP